MSAIESDFKYIKPTSRDSISRKQGGVLFRAAKEGHIEMSDKAAKFMYGRLVSDRPLLTTNSHDQDIAAKAAGAVSAAFDGNYKAAVRLYNDSVASYFAAYKDAIFAGKPSDYKIAVAKKRRSR